VRAKPLAWINRKVPSTILTVGLAAFCIWAGVGERADLDFLKEHGRQATAIVISIDGVGRHTTTAVRFDSVHDGVVEVTLHEVVGPEEVGEEIEVVYDPDDPQFNLDIRALEDPFVLYRWWFAAGVSGLLAALTGFGVIDWQRWSKRR